MLVWRCAWDGVLRWGAEDQEGCRWLVAAGLVAVDIWNGCCEAGCCPLRASSTVAGPQTCME